MNKHRGSGSIYKQKGSSVLWVKYYRNGKAYRESSQTTDVNDAEKFLRKRLAEITAGTFVGPQAERTKVEELAEDFLRDYRINNRKSLDDAKARWELHLKPFFGHLKAVEVSSSTVARYVDQRQSQGAKNATINRELAALKRLFRLGHQSTPPKVNRVPAFPKLAERNIRTGFLDDTQYGKLASACHEHWLRALLEVGYTYGWRVGELLNLRVKQTDLLSRTIRLDPGTTKNGDGRMVTMTGPVYELLSRCVQGKSPDDPLFTRENNSAVRDFRQSWAKACAEAGVPRLLFHDLRRTAARNLRRAGVAEGVIMKIGGWRTRSMFDRYAIVNETDIADALRTLEARPRHDGHSLGIVTQTGEDSQANQKPN